MIRKCMLILILFVACNSISHAADVSFTATDSKSAEAVALDSVRILNNFNGQDTVLIGSFVIDLYDLTGVENDFSNSTISNISSISFENEVTIPYLGTVNSFANISLCDITGSIIYKSRLQFSKDKSNIHMTASSITQGVYFLTIESQGNLSVYKLAKTGSSCGGDPKFSEIEGDLSSDTQNSLKAHAAPSSQFTAIAYSKTYQPDTLNFDMQPSGVNLVFTMVKTPAPALYRKVLFNMQIPLELSLGVTVSPNSGQCSSLCFSLSRYKSVLTINASLATNSDTTFQTSSNNSMNYFRLSYSVNNSEIPNLMIGNYSISVYKDQNLEGKYFFRIQGDYSNGGSISQKMDISFAMENFQDFSGDSLVVNTVGNDVKQVINFLRNDKYKMSGYCPPDNQTITCEGDYYEKKSGIITEYESAFIKVKYIK